MNILVVNDDGINAEGIEALYTIFTKHGHKVLVAAPEKEESGTGHGVTLHDPLRVREVRRDGKCFGYAINGKPSDCVKLGYWALYKEYNIDILISGINNGENLGTDVLYSGTVSGAAEGGIIGIKSIAVSLVNPEPNPRYEMVTEFLVDYIEDTKDYDLGENTILNINIPNIDKSEIKGIKYTKQGNRKYKDEFIERDDPRGNKYYWLGGEAVESIDDDTADFNVVKEGYISITPLCLNLTDHKKRKELEERASE